MAAAAARFTGTKKTFREGVVAEFAQEPVVVVNQALREVWTPVRGKRRERVVEDIEFEVAAGLSLPDSAREIPSKKRFEVGEDAVAGRAGAKPEAKREDIGVERGSDGPQRSPVASTDIVPEQAGGGALDPCSLVAEGGGFGGFSQRRSQ